ncbi:MAG: ribulose-phosphate 3-epimerase [Phycisphaeraceae bacterium]|nr:ribulose-phosphate 3-epimerase [Phycisphaeraceae bacterium]MCB9847365.1 ribulose-phosphate 3-epimerase [Phycisphaeraceae bacterium]
MARAPRNEILEPTTLPIVAPSILSADFANMAEECRSVLHDEVGGRVGSDGARTLHLDVMDGKFVPNLTMGPDMIRAMRRAFPEVTLDVHLMVTDPQDFIQPFADAGADHFTFHIEPALGIMKSKGEPTAPPHYDVRDIAERVRTAGMTAGLAINPPTPVEAIEPLLAEFDMILVMSINPGFSGQKFMPETLETTRWIRQRLRGAQRLEMDGGVNPENAAAVRRAGCDTLVAASAIFGRPAGERLGIIRALRDDAADAG